MVMKMSLAGGQVDSTACRTSVRIIMQMLPKVKGKNENGNSTKETETFWKGPKERTIEKEEFQKEGEDSEPMVFFLGRMFEIPKRSQKT